MARPGAFADVEAPALSDDDFDRVRLLIRRFAGVALADSKRNMVQSRLAKRVRARECASLRQYLDIVEDDGEEAQRFINALTTHLTAFFRESYHFPILADHLARDPAYANPSRRIRIWCAAASTGEEPWSIAMTASRALDRPERFDLLATDIDTQCLATAERGVYPIDAIESVELEDRRRWMLRGTGQNAGSVRIRPELGRHVRFARFNLMDPQWRHPEPFDVVFCRNVLIYFDGPTKVEVMRKLHGAMRPDGLLFIGHSESFNDAANLFRLEGKTVYRRLGSAA
ncbi:MAG: CheR family methyltransferase [Lautropia sp.]